MNSRIEQNTKRQIRQQNELDPLNIHELIFQQKLFLPIIVSKYEEPQIEPLIFKVMKQKKMEKILVYIVSQIDIYILFKIEITMDIFFHLNHQFQMSFKKLSDFVQFLRSSFEEIQYNEKIGFIEVFQDHSRKTIVFQIQKMLGGKKYTVIQLKGQSQSKELQTQYAAFRYGSIQDRIKQKQQKIAQLKQLVRLKNPYLLKNFKQL